MDRSGAIDQIFIIYAYISLINHHRKNSFSCKGEAGAYVVRVGGKKGSCNVLLVPLGRATSDENMIQPSFVLWAAEADFIYLAM